MVELQVAVTMTVDGQTVQVQEGSSVVAAIAQAARAASATISGAVVTRRSVTGELRGPLCGMGVCQECRVTIDGVPHRLACQTLCARGMTVATGKALA
ncbi:2Fe-2S iron-sulfur cluster-binding protein [Paraburkholderia ferrariae]|jgi:predicted molibdopterin-dependent oxidoreductase YjgC|uniref:2Fe-2S iron-sulfur cluster-binding protein n=1 Tax=Paraburkholderia ferrariae TaxID=386056 RepID=UPI000486BC64|nr:2Fe-2S iron-sulfur cluster-binding protein [Paraburkholderia ferrariae]